MTSAGGRRGRRSGVGSSQHARRTVAARLAARRREIEEEILARVEAVSSTTKSVDAEYTEGRRAAVSAALDLALTGIERGDTSALPIPVALLSQARLAARNGVGLETTLRRHFAGYTVLSRFLFDETQDGVLLTGPGLKTLVEGQAGIFDRLVDAVTEEHARESRSRLTSTEQRRADKVRKLLACKVVDTSDLGYEFNACHLGLIARGGIAAEVLKDLASALGCNVLLVCQDEDAVWAWLGSRRELDIDELEQMVSSLWPSRIPLSMGALGHGLSGWRRTHEQASAAFRIALRKPGAFIRYADDPLLAATLQDELLGSSLHELFLAPLEGGHDDGERLRATLRAYFAAGRNGASAAKALKVSRQTVRNHLQLTEDRIGRPLSVCVTEIETALRLQDLFAASTDQTLG